MHKFDLPTLLRSTVCALGLLSAPFLSAQSSFDPVHEDTDIFMVNPTIDEQRPNVLILLDNTANWNTPFDNEKNALVSVVNGLDERFNVGLAMFVETGNPNDNVDGAYVRFGIRQMTTTPVNNKDALSNMVDALDKLGDKGNNATPALALGEVYNYFAARSSYSGWGKVKADYPGNTVYNALASPLPGHPFALQPTSSNPASRIYTSPVVDNCQKNFIIYISNGAVSENSSALATARAQLEAAKGSAATTIPLSPSGQQGNWADEWAGFMANSGFDVTIGSTQQNVKVSTYTIEVDPATTGQGPDTTALMKSMAAQGKGKYYSTSSGGSASSLVDALKNIFNEIQAVNSVFASTTLPVSVNVRGTNLNQVYIGMFRPDAKKAPRWHGNLKLYKLALDGDSLILADALGAAAENPDTGFVRNTAVSHWTHNSSFWGFRTSDENGTGGASDSPDGDLVEKGAVAQQMREAYATSQATRNLYTCTGSGCTPCTISGSNCDGSVALSSMPFATTNSAITPAVLGLGNKAVAALSAKSTKTVTALTDRRSVAITNASGAITVSSLSNGATTRTIGSLNTTRGPFPITTLSAATPVTRTISNVTNATSGSGSGKTNTFTVTTASAHGLAAGNSFTISGNTASGGSDINNTYTVSEVVNSTQFKFVGATGNLKWGTNGSVDYTGTSTTALATLNGHLFTNLQSVTITGAAESAFNGTFNITVLDANRFSYSLPSPQGATSGASVSGPSQIAQVTTATVHDFIAGDTVTIAGATLSGYNGSFPIKTPITANSFTYSLTDVTPAPPYLNPNTGTGATATKGGSMQVNVTTSADHDLDAGSSFTMSGADSCYNGTDVVSTSPSPTATTFSYTTSSVCPQNFSTTASVSTGYSPIVTATLPNHGYFAGNAVFIDDGAVAEHNGTFSITDVPTTDTFTYENNVASGAGKAPAGAYSVRLASNPLAYASASAHGFTTGDSIVMAGATPAGYNGAKTIAVVDANTFSYPLSTALGTPTGTITASKDTTTAVANVVNHGFANSDSIAISGASPSIFNGTYTIAFIDANNFSYTLSSPQGDATGAITASNNGTGSNSERDAIINWVRGQDNQEDENKNGSSTDCRASIHNDVLHSRPAVINYNRFGSDNDVYVYYGSNDGVFRGVKGGLAADPGEPQPGNEVWGFIPVEGFPSLQRLRNNSPLISSRFRKPYFMDGPIGVYSLDGNGDGQLNFATTSDLVHLYAGARRGGRYFYSFDVINPAVPKYRWKIDNAASGFNELGYSWSQPTVVTNIAGWTNPVLIFGGGYDPAVEDIENCTIISADATSVTYYSGAILYTTDADGCTKADGSAIEAVSPANVTVSRTMGRALYVVDAITGELVWWASRPGSGATLEVSDMDFAIPSDPIVVRNLSGGSTNRAYVGDTGGNVWRFDFGSTDRSNWTMTKLASVSDLTTKAGRRKFLYPPDVVDMNDFDAVLIGSGDREHPFDYTVTNRFYMFKDRGNDSGPLTGTTVGNPTLTEAMLFDATDNCVQVVCPDMARDTALDLLDDAGGWFFTLDPGEKNIGNAVALNGVVFFNTNQPSTSSSSCSNLGIARQYQVAVADATAFKAERATIHEGGGYLPSPVHVVVQIEGKTVEGVISGTSVEQPPGTTLNARTRQFWYKEID